MIDTIEFQIRGRIIKRQRLNGLEWVRKLKE